MTATPLSRPPAPAPGIPPSLGDVGPQEAGTLAVANAALRGGFVLLPRTLLHAPGLSRDAKLLYAVLLSYAWQQGSCFPGYARLQQDLDCSANSLTRYLGELERAGLITRRRRGLGKTTLYTLQDSPAAPTGIMGRRLPPASTSSGQSRSFCDSVPPKRVTVESQKVRPESDSGETDSVEHHQAPALPATVAPTSPAGDWPSGAVDDALVALLTDHGVTGRIARELATGYDAEALRRQVEWHRSRPPATNPAGALVLAIREDWPPPAAWIGHRRQQAVLARRQEEEAARQAEEEEALRQREDARLRLSPEERVAGRVQAWIVRQRLKGRPPTDAEITEHRTRLAAAEAELGLPAPPVSTAP